ncbi:hypothetical protein BT69DRAFT_1291941 [Atractiella rhizophila]|nr:hypothetical protein BT69DRAFT_1291941 [Atractiella rhizophila]
MASKGDLRDLNDLPLSTTKVLRTLLWPTIHNSHFFVVNWSIPIFPSLRLLGISGLEQGNILDLVPSFWSAFPALETLIVKSSDRGPLWISFDEPDTPKLTKLVLDTQGGREGRFYSVPRLQQSLRCLSLRESTISNSVDLAAVLLSLPCLRELTLLDISRPVLAVLPNLTELRLEGPVMPGELAFRTTSLSQSLCHVFPKLSQFRSLQSLTLQRLFIDSGSRSYPFRFSLDHLHISYCHIADSSDFLLVTTRDLYVRPYNLLAPFSFFLPFPRLVALEYCGTLEDLKPFESAAIGLQALSFVHDVIPSRTTHPDYYTDDQLHLNFPALKKLSVRATWAKKRFDMLCVLVRDVEMRRLDKLENVELRLSDYEFKLVSWRRNDLVNRLKKAGLTVVVCNDDMHDESSRWNAWKEDVLRN